MLGSGEFPAMAEWIDARLASSGDKVFLHDLDQDVAYSYRETAARISAICDRLSALGVGPGDSIASNLANGPELAFVILASLRLGSRLALIEPQVPNARLTKFLALAEAGWIVTENVANRESRDFGPAMIVESAALTAGDDNHSSLADLPVSERSDDEAFVIFSSGTSGEPKGIVHTHGNAAHELNGMLSAYRFTEDMRHLSILSMAHVSGLYRSLLMPFCSGGTVMLRRAFNIEVFWRDMAEHRVNFVQLVPSHIAMLNRSEYGPDPRELADLTYIGTASAYLPPSEQLRFEKRFGTPVLQGYGLTETTCGIALNSLDPSVRRPGVAGQPLPVNKIKIADSAGIEVDTGEIGDVLVRGENVTRKWLGDAQPDMVNGWLRTGDLGSLGEDGNLTLVGRKTNVVNRGAFKIYTMEVEGALLSLPEIDDVAVIGVPNTILGEDLIAFVTPATIAAPDGLLSQLRATIASYKVPSLIMPIPEIPRNALGKVQRDQLLEIFQADRDGSGVSVGEFQIADIQKIVSNSLNIDPSSVGPDFSLEDCPTWDSLEHMKILIAIERHFNLPPQEDADALAARTISDLAGLVAR